MANPQIENGYTRLANELLEAMCRTRFATNESQVVLFLARMTYGYNKKAARIPTATWVAGTDMKATHIYRTLNKLLARNVVTRAGPKGAYRWSIQKDYRKWKVVTTPGLCDQGWSQVRTKAGHNLRTTRGHSTFKDKRQLKDSEPCPQCGAPKKESWHTLCSKCFGQPTGRVQPSNVQPEPCTKCGWTAYPGYEDMKDGVCLDCRQEGNL